MFRSIALWTTMTVTALAADGEYSASTNADAALRAAPNVKAEQLSIVPAQTSLAVTVCFYEGAYCHVTGPEIDGYVAGELLTIVGEQSTVRDAETARWALINGNRRPVVSEDGTANEVVFWGDSLPNASLGRALSALLPDVVVSMQGVPGENGAQIAERMLANILRPGSLQIIWDRHYTNEASEDYLRDIATMADRARSQGDFLVISDIRQLPTSETATDPVSDAGITKANNDQLAKLYPGNFVDVTSALEDPATRGPDGLHLSTSGNAAVAQLLAAAIEARGSGSQANGL